MEEAVAKAVVGFLNSEQGGTLIIGIADTKVVLGLEADYGTFKNIKPGPRRFRCRHFEMCLSELSARRSTPETSGSASEK